MDFCFLIKISRHTISSWYKIGDSRHLPFSINGENSFPLAFYINNTDFAMGTFAVEKSLSGDINAFNNYFELIKDPYRTFSFHGSSYPLNQLLCFGIDKLLDLFLKNFYSQASTILETSRSCIPLFIMFEPDIVKQEQEFVESVLYQFGYTGVCVVKNEASLLSSLSRESQIKQTSTFFYMTGLGNDLFICVVNAVSNENISIVTLKNEGGDIRYKHLAEEIFDDIENRNPQLSINREKEMPRLLAEARNIIAKNIPLAIGQIQLSNGTTCEYYVQLRQIEEKLRYSNSGQIIASELERLIKVHKLNIANSTFIINGQNLNAEYISERLKQKFLNIYVLPGNFHDQWIRDIFEWASKAGKQKKPKREVASESITEPKVPQKEPVKNNLRIGIDLGTTFCCVSYINEKGEPEVIPDNRGRKITPSVIWYDGATAYIGEEANKKKITISSPIYEFFKRNMGKPVEDKSGNKKCVAYEIKGIKYGATGMSAILLRKLKRDAWQYFKKKKIIDQGIKESELAVDAVITVPAYFGDEARTATKFAGRLAGINVVGIINEPTAAALTYGISLTENKRIMVFDLGGGTLDVTVLQIVSEGFFKVIASDGNNELGGKDWDDVIMKYLSTKFQEETGTEFPDERLFDLQQLAIQAKKDLSENDETTVYLSANGYDVEAILYRSAHGAVEDAGSFYFDKACEKLLNRCVERCNHVLKTSNLSWNEIDEIAMAGGSCRMPMIREMLEKISLKKIKINHTHFDYDTAISFGASLMELKHGNITDISSKSIGIKLVDQQQKEFIDHLIRKNTPLPARIRKKYMADPYARLEVYEGDSKDPIDCVQLGTLELENTRDSAVIILEIDVHGILRVHADYQPEGTKETKIRGSSEFPIELYDIIQNITIIS